MRYLYGDSSAFPLNQNFLETLSAATECCCALLKVEEAKQNASKVADQAGSAAIKELADIDQLLQRFEKSLSQRDHLSNATAKVVEQVAATAKGQFDRARDGIQAWRDGTIRKAQQGCGPADIMAPVHRFLVKHELPYTSWGLRWKSGQNEEPVQAQVYAIMQRGLTATLGVAIPARHMWAQPIRVGQLEPGIIIQLMGKSWLGKEKMLDENLDKHFITRITRTSERHALILSKKAKEPSDMLRLSFREDEVKRLTVQRIDDDENPVGDALTLTGEDAQQVKRLWRQVEESICDLVHYRSQLLAATLHNKRVTEIESPATIAVSVIQSIAPLVRDLKRHSRAPNELQLKRDLGDGRREELFIDQRDVTGKYGSLSLKNQQLFDCFGLGKAQVPQARASQPAASRPGRSAPSQSAPSQSAPSQSAPSQPAPPHATPSQPAHAARAHAAPAHAAPSQAGRAAPSQPMMTAPSQTGPNAAPSHSGMNVSRSEPAPPHAAPSRPAQAYEKEKTDAIIPRAPHVPADVAASVHPDQTAHMPYAAQQPYVPAFPSEAPAAPAGPPGPPAAGSQPAAQQGGAPIIPSRPPRRPPKMPGANKKHLPSSLPPPSHPPRRRDAQTGQRPASQHPGPRPANPSAVFKLPPPTVPPQKRKKGSKVSHKRRVG